jgi:hypothetical protein
MLELPEQFLELDASRHNDGEPMKKPRKIGEAAGQATPNGVHGVQSSPGEFPR